MINWKTEKMPKHSEALIRLLAETPAKELLDMKGTEMEGLVEAITDLMNHCDGKPGVLNILEGHIIRAIKVATIIGGTSALMTWVQTARVSLTTEPGDNPLGDHTGAAYGGPQSTIDPQKEVRDGAQQRRRLNLADAHCRVCRRLLEHVEIMQHPGICQECLDEMSDGEEENHK